MNSRFVAIMTFYAYLTFKLGPDYLGTPNGYIAGAAGSFALYQTVGRDFAGY